MKNICNLTSSERADHKIKYLSSISSSTIIWRKQNSKIEELISKSNDLIAKIRSCPECQVSRDDLEAVKSLKNMALSLELEGNIEEHSATQQAYALYNYMQNEFEYCQ